MLHRDLTVFNRYIQNSNTNWSTLAYWPLREIANVIKMPNSYFNHFKILHQKRCPENALVGSFGNNSSKHHHLPQFSSDLELCTAYEQQKTYCFLAKAKYSNMHVNCMQQNSTCIIVSTPCSFLQLSISDHISMALSRSNFLAFKNLQSIQICFQYEKRSNATRELESHGLTMYEKTTTILLFKKHLYFQTVMEKEKRRN